MRSAQETVTDGQPEKDINNVPHSLAYNSIEIWGDLDRASSTVWHHCSTIFQTVNYPCLTALYKDEGTWIRHQVLHCMTSMLNYLLSSSKRQQWLLFHTPTSHKSIFRSSQSVQPNQTNNLKRCFKLLALQLCIWTKYQAPPCMTSLVNCLWTV